MENFVARKLRVEGRVQRVGFRAFVSEAARAFDIGGSVRNLPDGSVEIRAQGSRENMRSFIEQIEIGPAGSRVDKVTVDPDPDPPTVSGFGIVR